jgi:hypothetical protein
MHEQSLEPVLKDVLVAMRGDLCVGEAYPQC